MSTFRRRLSLAFALILLLTSPCTAEPAQEAKYYLFRESRVPLEALIPYIHSTDPSAPYVHPMLKGGEYKNVLMSVPARGQTQGRRHLDLLPYRS